jgi:hypothetical protein
VDEIVILSAELSVSKAITSRIADMDVEKEQASLAP